MKILIVNGSRDGATARSPASASWSKGTTGGPLAPRVGEIGHLYKWLSRDLRASLASKSPARELVRALRLVCTVVHHIWSWTESTLAFRFLGCQVARHIRQRLNRSSRISSLV
jgi:hypothetical protein